jgi:hypothetical protein
MHFPLKWPEGYKSRVDSAIGTTQRKFKDDPYKMLERVRDGMDAFVGIALEAIKNGDWPKNVAYDGFIQFLHTLTCHDAEQNKWIGWSTTSDRIHKLEVEIQGSKEWTGWMDRLTATAAKAPISDKIEPKPKPTKKNMRTERKEIRESYFSKFPEKIFVLDVCWAARQRYREFTRWIGGELKDGSKADRAFRAVLLGDKRPEQIRPEIRQKDWK